MFYCIPLRDYLCQVEAYFEKKYPLSDRMMHQHDFISFLIDDFQILEIMNFYWNHPHYPLANKSDIEDQLVSIIHVMAYDEIDLIEGSDFYHDTISLIRLLSHYVFLYLNSQKLPFYGMFKGHHLSTNGDYYNSFLYLEYLPFKDYTVTNHESIPHETYDEFPF